MILILTSFVALLSVAAAEYKVVCYYTNWAQYRKGAGAAFFPEDVDPNLCTHVIYSFAYLKEGGVIGDREWNDLDTEWSKGMYTRFNDLKAKNPALKTMLAVGGWTHPWELFSKAVADKDSREKLNKSIIKFLRRWNFDGFDLDWEYPGNRGSPPGDKQKFTLWCKELREAFETEAKESGKERLLLSAAVGAGKSTVDSAYEIGKIAHDLDFINLMAYDLHGSWEKFVQNHSPLKARASEPAPQSYLNVEWVTRYWKKQIVDGGSSSTKLVLGLPTYGRSYTLATKDTGVGAAAKGAGNIGPATKEAGFLSYFEICDMIKNGAEQVWDEQQQYPYIHQSNQWAGYDDQRSLKLKVDFIKKEGLGGGMFWALDLDDFKGKHCGQGKYPLISFVSKSLKGESPEVVVPTSGPKPTKRPGKGKGTGNEKGNGKHKGKGKEPAEVTCETDGLFANPGSCTTFVQCANGQRYEKDCPAGLHFSESVGTCVWPQESKCKE